MFTVCGILDVKTGAFAKAALPYFIAIAIFLAALVAFPGLSLYMPSQLM